MPLYGVDWTGLVGNTEAELGDDVQKALAEIYGDVTTERWTCSVSGVELARLIYTVSAPCLTEALGTVHSQSVRLRERLGLPPGHALAISLAIRDLSRPIELTLPPPRSLGG